MDVPVFMELMKKYGFSFYTGVPGSSLKGVVNYLNDDTEDDIVHVRASNECEAIAISTGYHLASKKTGVIYMQNSGLGKAVNPLTSLTDPEVYSIPCLLLIGWRGEPGQVDDPQHIKMGRILKKLLDVLEIPHQELPEDPNECEKVIKTAKDHMDSHQSTYALIAKRRYFDEYYPQGKISGACESELIGEDVFDTIIELMDKEDVFVANTGRISRRFASVIKAKGINPEDCGKVVYNLGSLGCASAIGYGISTNYKGRVTVFDGDGSVLMQMGTLSTIGHYKPDNLYHIVIDNACYASTGTHPTNASSVDFMKIAEANGYRWTGIVDSYEYLKPKLREFYSSEGPNLLVIRISEPLKGNLPRLVKPLAYKEAFFKFLQEFRMKN